ncbi:hypothetical protein BYT27DRAFT_7157664 [Phlegmacium glaucopus]|nr:hypothetical protein BYT27DRAFT_7157664 [Phlegmacium glaucopus]
MPIATALALLLGLGARILLDHFSRFESPSIKDFILVGAWQGVALYYTTKTSGFGVIIAFGIVAKLFIEFNFVPDTTKCVTTVVGIALGVLFTDFLSQYFDKPPRSSDRRRKKQQSAPTPVKPEKKRSRLVQFRPSVQGGSVETVIDPVPSSFVLSDITSVDSRSDALDPSPSMSPSEREVHILRTRASLADSERRRCKEERKWAISQGNIARASQMKWEVKRYTALMQTFTREADLKAMEGTNTLASTNLSSHHQNDIEDQKQTPFNSREKGNRSYRDHSVNDLQTNGHAGHKTSHPRRTTSTKRDSSRDANG